MIFPFQVELIDVGCVVFGRAGMARARSFDVVFRM